MKIDKYNTTDILGYVQRWSGVDTLPIVSSVTVNWRGIVAPGTLSLLKDLRIPLSYVDLLVARTLRGSVSIYANYMGTSGGGDIT